MELHMRSWYSSHQLEVNDQTSLNIHQNIHCLKTQRIEEGEGSNKTYTTRVPLNIFASVCAVWMTVHFIQESNAQFENRIKPRVYVRRITGSTMYKKAHLFVGKKGVRNIRF